MRAPNSKIKLASLEKISPSFIKSASGLRLHFSLPRHEIPVVPTISYMYMYYLVASSRVATGQSGIAFSSLVAT
jgi:hypothetical protein